MYIQIGKIRVSELLYDFIESEALVGLNINNEDFWDGFEKIIADFTPKNEELLNTRAALQQQIDDWHHNHETFNHAQYKDFLSAIGYLEEEVDDFKISTENVDEEIASQAGPQLVVPLDNARFALNAANARWGSLYDALYGSDVISEDGGAERGNEYNALRGSKVIGYAKAFLDRAVPLKEALHEEAVRYFIYDGALQAELKSGSKATLQDHEKFLAYLGEESNPNTLLFKNNGIHIEVQIDRDHLIGKSDSAGIKDILLEAALTTIMDCEDAVAAVDVEDKVSIYRNWLGLMQGTLQATFEKNGRSFNRVLNADRKYTALDGREMTLKGRSLLFVRNVGHLMTSDAVLLGDGREVPEGIIDAVVTSLVAMHSFNPGTIFGNSAKDSIYIVKPKMHGSKEVAFTNELFNHVEDLLGLKRNTIKMGVMDEERRTSLNLKNCIYEARERIVFINTGFLDRTGDELHTSKMAGPMLRKNEMKTSSWLQAYEHSNVIQGLFSGFQNRAQIGKGMWAMPDLMKAMVEQKINHPLAGANTAWVPSPTAAVLHALHYHEVNVQDTQKKLTGNLIELREQMLEIPLAIHVKWSESEVQAELDNNIQGILGYVVRWINQGIGCSKVPDIYNVGLMEDRATLRISSQHIVNWLLHGVCTEEQVINSLKKMATVVDEQNETDTNYQPIGTNYEQSFAYRAAKELIFKGLEQPNGYTEPILHQWRKKQKNLTSAAI